MSLGTAVWYAYLAIEAILILLLIYRRVWRSLPTFFLYCVWDLFSNLSALFVTRFYSGNYLNVYFTETVIDSIFLFCVLLELAWSLLRPLRTFISRKMILVLGALILMAAASIWPFAAISNIIRGSREAHTLMQLQQTTAILRIFFFLLLAAGSRSLSISWRDRELQVATGLGFFSLVNISVSIAQFHMNDELTYARLQTLIVAGFTCSLCYWIYCFAQKEPERREFTPEMRRVLLALAGAAHADRIALESRTDKPGKRDRD